MIYYSREIKTLVIPEGIGNYEWSDDYLSGVRDGKAIQKAADDAKITPTTAITENGSYEADYGFKNVVVNLDYSDEIETAYDSGYTAGVERGKVLQKSLLASIRVTSNGTFHREDGYGYVTVAVPEPQLQEKVVEMDDISTTYVPDRGYDGISSIEVDASGVYASGRERGQSDQKALLSSTAITENGTYTRADGWNSVTVNVPSGPSFGVIVAVGTFTVDNDVTMSSSDGYRMFTSAPQGYIKDGNGNYIVNGTDADILGQTLYSGQTYSFYFILGTISNGVITWESDRQNTPIEYLGYTSATANFTTNLNYKME